MSCVSHFRNSAIRATLALLALPGLVARCSVAPSHSDFAYRSPLSRLEQSLRSAPSHISEFSPVNAPLALPKCGHVHPPEALLTPDPLLSVEDDDLKVRVSFIVGSDGHVYSAFILESGGMDEDRLVLQTVHNWRYRPALCNGVPTDSEAQVRFALQ
jgi:TonB family protein